MVTLLCFCCDHRNPAGAKFCNACGTPLHLKPCKHCEAINVRAAAHCHQCGETFALEYLLLDDPAQTPDPPDAASGLAPTEASREAAYSPPRRRDAFTTRIVALLLTLTATALLSTYYAYRHPGSGVDAAGVGELSPSTGSSVVPVSVPADVAETPNSPVATFYRPGQAVSPSEPRGDAKASSAPPSASIKARAESAHPQPGARRTAQARPAKSNAEPARRGHRPTSVEPVATSPTAGVRQDEPRPQPDPGPIALQQTVVAPPPRPPAPRPAPVPRGPESAKRPPPASGGWGRPCAGGVALDSGCDVRTLQKGD
jgi:Double zinc ribbon